MRPYRAVTDKAAVNMGVQLPLQGPGFASFGSIPRSGITGSYERSLCNFGGAAVLFSIMAVPATLHRGPLFSASSPTRAVSFPFDDSHPNRWEVTSYWGFDLHFSNDK